MLNNKINYRFDRSLFSLQDDSSSIRLLRLKVFAGHNLAKKDIFGASDPYVRIDLIRNADDSVIDSVYTKTKKKVFLYFYLYIEFTLL